MEKVGRIELIAVRILISVSSLIMIATFVASEVVECVEDMKSKTVEADEKKVPIPKGIGTLD